MKKRLYFLSLVLFLGASLCFTSSCSRGYGCPTDGTKATKKEIRKGGSSNLFGKAPKGKNKRRY